MSTRKITPDFVKALMAKGLNDDAHVSGNYWCDFLDAFEADNGVKITDVVFRDDVLSITIDNKKHVNFKITIEKLK